MLRHSRLAVILWLVAIALLPLRAANAHVHLCLDGKEPAAAMHVLDVPMHHGAGHEVDGHNDRDMQLSDSLPVQKSQTPDLNKVSLLGAYVLARILPAPVVSAPATAILIPDFLVPLDLLPPPRGPPA